MYVHGDNLRQKENHTTKYLDADSRRYLVEIRVKYDEWKAANEALTGPISETDSESTTEIITSRVQLFNDYKDFIDQQHYAEKFTKFTLEFTFKRIRGVYVLSFL